jgi:hypothetical protein
MSTEWQQEAGMASGDDLENIQGYTEQALQAKVDAEAAEVEATRQAGLAEDAKDLALQAQTAAGISATAAANSASSITGSVTAAQDAQAAAEAAQGLAEDAYDDTVTSRSEASGFATSASGSAGDALTYRGQALTYKDQAETAKDTAVSAANSTAGSVTQANDAKVAAETAQGLAESAQGAAESARVGAESAQTAAESAAGSVTALAAQASDDANSASGSAEAADLSAQAASESEDNANTSYQNTVQTYQDTLGIYGSISAVEQAVDQAQTAVTDATSQVSLAAAEKVGAQTARDTAESFKDQAYTYSQSAASAVAYQDLTAIAETKAKSAVDVFVYDTSKDSDGGAWRQRTQGTSWYNETLNTATRGSRKEFPAVAVIVAEANKVTIYDGDDPSLPMWWTVSGSYSNSGNSLFYSNTLDDGSGARVYAFNGNIVLGIPYGNQNGGLRVLSFAGDNVKRITANSSYNGYWYTIESVREGASDIQDKSINPIVNHTVNDVAMTVLPDAPIDPATGLPIPTIAVATNGGVSVIKDDGTVVDITVSSGQAFFMYLDFLEDNKIITKANYDGEVLIFSIPDSDATTATVPDRYAFFNGTAGYDKPNSLSDVNRYNKDVATCSTLGLQNISLLDSASSSMTAKVTSDYNTGWMNGDIKLATLSDTDDTDLVGTELADFSLSGTHNNSNQTDVTLSGSDIVITYVSGAPAWGGFVFVGLTVGKTYVLNFESTGSYGFTRIGNTQSGGITFSGNSYSFKATNAEMYLNFGIYSQQGPVIVSSLSVRLAEPDRSVNNNGLQVFGTVQKNPVATGADLVAYSGFSGSNYLMQPYNSDLDFGTGDFHYSVWFNRSSSTFICRLGGRADSTTEKRFEVYIAGATTLPVFYVRDGSSSSVTSSISAPNNTWNLVSAVRKDNVMYLYVNGKLAGTATSSQDVSSTSSQPFRVGAISYDGGANAGYNYARDTSLALFKLSATAPTAEQIAKIYRDEKVLFQENAKATLHGTSDAVTALAYDDTTELLHVGTSAGRSVFQGLRRVDNTTDAVGTAISASNGLVAEE